MKRKLLLLETCSDECSSSLCDFDKDFPHRDIVNNKNNDLICITSSFDNSESSLTKKVKLNTTNNTKTTTDNSWPPPFLGNGLYLSKVDCLPPETNQRALSLFELIRQIRPIASIHFSFCIDPGWVVKQYSRSLRNNPITFIVGQPELGELEKECKNWPNIQCAGAILPFPFGTHHTKLSLFESEHSLHVVVSTANLMPQDWTFKTQTFYHFAAPFTQKAMSLNETKDVENVKTKCSTTSQRLTLKNFICFGIRGIILHYLEAFASFLTFSPHFYFASFMGLINCGFSLPWHSKTSKFLPAALKMIFLASSAQ